MFYVVLKTKEEVLNEPLIHTEFNVNDVGECANKYSHIHLRSYEIFERELGDKFRLNTQAMESRRSIINGVAYPINCYDTIICSIPEVFVSKVVEDDLTEEDFANGEDDED